MNQKHHFVLYIPFWESIDSLSQHMAYYEDLGEAFLISVIFDGGSPIPTSLPVTHNPTPKGLVQSLREHSISSHNVTILRQGVYPTSQEHAHALQQIQQSDVVYVGEEYADDGFVMMNSNGYRVFLRSEPRLYSIGYGVSAHALWEKHGLSCARVSIAKHEIQEPDAHRKQICSNILRAWLAAKQIYFFKHRSRPSWYTPISDKISIVIPVWNNLHLVQQCVQSILKCTLHPFEIVLVDNASHEPICAWAEPMSAKHSNITYVRNSINHGFPQGCNIGIKHATGEHILLLNSDTVVTPYWLSMLVAGLRDDSVGLVSGISCNIGLDDQCIKKPSYRNHKELVRFAQEQNTTHHGHQTHTTLVVFLLVLIRGALKDKIGGLDPIFSFGNCEDSDYCFRAYRAGFKAQIMRDVYIDHVGSASFQKQSFSYEQLIHQNIQYAVGKNIPQELHEQYRGATIDERWATLRPFDEQWDVLPFSMEDFTKKSMPLSSPFAKKDTVLMFPHPSSSWLSTLQKILRESQYSVILRIDPPTASYVEDVQHQCAHLLQEERQRVYLETSPLPTHYRKSIYDLAEYYVRPTRFDAFHFLREIAYMNITELV